MGYNAGMMDAASLRFMWGYMADADAQVLAASASVSDEGFARDQGISFGSIEKLLSHAMTAQSVWLRRLRGEDVAYAELPAVPRAALAGRWGAIHADMLAFAGEQTAETLGRVIRSRNRAGKVFELPAWVVMHHVADHATYHRGQLNSMIKLAGGTPSGVMAYTHAVGRGFGREV